MLDPPPLPPPPKSFAWHIIPGFMGFYTPPPLSDNWLSEEYHTKKNNTKDCKNMGGTGLKFESWKVKNDTQDASQRHFFNCFLKKFWTLKAIAGKVQPKQKEGQYKNILLTTWDTVAERRHHQGLSLCDRQLLLSRPAIKQNSKCLQWNYQNWQQLETN